MSTIIRTEWRGVPPEGSEQTQPWWLDGKPPTWSTTSGFTLEQARELLTEHYGADWTLQEQVTTVSDWTVVTP